MSSLSFSLSFHLLIVKAQTVRFHPKVTLRGTGETSDYLHAISGSKRLKDSQARVPCAYLADKPRYAL